MPSCFKRWYVRGELRLGFGYQFNNVPNFPIDLSGSFLLPFNKYFGLSATGRFSWATFYPALKPDLSALLGLYVIF